MKSTGLFFGSFNPIHIGHLIIANAVAEKASLDEVWFVVSPQNPFKSSRSLLHEFDRFDMVQMAIEGNDRFRATDIEFHMPKPAFTIDTLTYLSDKNPKRNFKLIVGEDNLESFTKWKNYQKILEYYELIVYPRPNAEVSEFKNHPKVKMVKAPLIEISATFIRECIKEGHSIKYLVPDKVADYIYQKKFYR